MIAWIDYIAVGAIGFALACLLLAIFISHSYRHPGPDDDDPQ